MWQHKWAVWSGFLGATASCLVKLGVASDSPLLEVLQAKVCEGTLQGRWLTDLDEILGKFLANNPNMEDWKIVRTMRDLAEEFALFFHLFEVDYCRLCFVVPLRLVCVVAMILTNVYMVACFLKGMQDSGSVRGTSLATASNFASSALYGHLLWDEKLNKRWCFGFACVLIGVMLLSSETATSQAATESDGDKSVAQELQSHNKEGSYWDSSNLPPRRNRRPTKKAY